MPWTKNVLLWGHWILLQNTLNKEYTSLWGYWILLHNTLNKEYTSVRLLDLTSQYPEQRMYFCEVIGSYFIIPWTKNILLYEVIGSYFTMPWTKNILLWGYWILLHNALNKEYTTVRLLDLTPQCPEQRVYFPMRSSDLASQLTNTVILVFNSISCFHAEILQKCNKITLFLK